MISLAPFSTLLRLKKGQHLLLANAAQTVGFHYNSDSPVVLHIYPSVIRILFFLVSSISYPGFNLSQSLAVVNEYFEVCDFFTNIFLYSLHNLTKTIFLHFRYT